VVAVLDVVVAAVFDVVAEELPNPVDVEAAAFPSLPVTEVDAPP